MWGDSRVVSLGGVVLGSTENDTRPSQMIKLTLTSVNWNQPEDESYPVLQIPHKPGFPTLFSSSSLVLLVSKQARPILCSMSSWCCCGLWVWPRLHGRTVSSSAPAWMRTPVFYQFIRGLDVAQGCWPVLLLPACKTAPVNIINIRYASSFSVYTCVCVKKQHPEEIFSAQGLLFHCSGDGIYSSRFFYVRT